MILMKGKHNFWSQLLLSMIAILALPQAQGLLSQASVTNENYQNTQLVQHQNVRSVAIVQHVQLQQRKAVVAPQSPRHILKNEPHFEAILAHSLPPIRAGPTFSS
ncbi:hypothetical protein I926_07115 [Pasteurella multocida subsp. multocida OH4807]|nr:hypothetical protein I926_07115 [Pasteurella multocida subsp. multocida OH4807]